MGTVLRQLDRRAEAEGCFRQALRLRPDFPEVYNNRGTTLRDLHRPDEAEVCFRDALRLMRQLCRGETAEVHGTPIRLPWLTLLTRTAVSGSCSLSASLDRTPGLLTLRVAP